MWKELRVYVMIAASALFCVGLFMALKLASSARMLHQAERGRDQRVTVIRHPNLRMPESQDTNTMVHNIAPLATVTVSSTGESSERLGGGVADGVVDTKEWITHEEMAGAGAHARAGGDLSRPLLFVRRVQSVAREEDPGRGPPQGEVG